MGFFLARDSYQKVKPFNFLKISQLAFPFPTRSLMGISSPPCGSGLLRNFVERTVASSSPLYSKKYLQNPLEAQ